MKSSRLFLITHMASAIFASAVVSLGNYSFGAIGLFFAIVLAAVTSGVTAWVAGSRFRKALQSVEDVVLKDAPPAANLGIWEVDQLIEKLSQFARQLSETTQQAQEESREVESLLRQMNRRSESRQGGQAPAHQLRYLLLSLTKAADGNLHHVIDCSAEIERRTQEMSAGAEQQSTAVSQATSFVEQMSANIDSVSQNADAANKAAVAARESASDGLELVRELICGMDNIRLHVEAGRKKLRTLGERSEEIGSIVETIAGISARTDMLALNASIESVRAGEHGRGFAVVAEEVRKLAEQTAHATSVVSGLIESIQLETQESIAAMADEHRQVEAEVQRVNEAGTALEKISTTSSDSAQRVGEISRATLNQLRFTQEVVRAMEHISEVARGIRRRADGVRGTTTTLQELAKALDDSLQPLRVRFESAPDSDEPTHREVTPIPAALAADTPLNIPATTV